MAGVKILVADNDAAITHLIERAVISEGYACVTVADGKAAKNELLRHNFALAILDETLPYLKGSEIALWLKYQNQISTPVIILSGEQQAAAIGGAFAGNLVVASLSKPFTARSLRQLLNLFVRKI